MSDQNNNKAPFEWQDLINKAVWAIVLVLAGWIYQTHERVSKIEDYDKTKTMFWQIHSQQRNAHNDLVDYLNDHRAPGEPKLERFRWDIDSDN